MGIHKGYSVSRSNWNGSWNHSRGIVGYFALGGTNKNDNGRDI